MAYGSVLQHRAVPLRPREDGPWIEGEPEIEDDEGTPFDCALFLPLSAEDGAAPRGRRQVRRPTLLLPPTDDDDVELTVSHADLLDVTAPELTGPEAVRWQVESGPQPFGRPGDPLVGSQVMLKRVED